MRKHNDDILMTEIFYIKDSVTRIERHMEKQNGILSKHGTFVDKQSILNWIYGTFFLATIAMLAKLIFFGGG